MNVLICDTETTGIDPVKDKCIEVACILYSLDHACAIESFSSLIRADSNEAEHINGISAAALKIAPDGNLVWCRVESLAVQADALVAHNAGFDRGFVSSELRGMRPWVCSQYDLTWPNASKLGASLIAIALAHELGISHAHRAMADCDILARLLTRVATEYEVDLHALIRRGMRPKATYEARVSFADKDLAKNAGFKWNGETKKWTRTMAIEDAANLGFQIVQVTP